MIWRRWKRETRAEEEMEKGGGRDGVGVGGWWGEGVEGGERDREGERRGRRRRERDRDRGKR